MVLHNLSHAFMRKDESIFIPMNMKIAFFSTKDYDKTYFNQFNTGHGFDIAFHEASLTADTVGLAASCAAVCVFVNDRLDAGVVNALADMGVLLIALRCAGFNNVDVKAASARNMSVVRVPAYSPHAVAEHAVALMLTLNRKTHKAYNRVREGNFSLERLTGFDFYGKTVGIVGTGRIGSVLARIMLGFGCQVLATDVCRNESLMASGVRYVELPELLAESDIISLHCPLTEQTRHLINDQTLGLTKRGVMLINTGRGALVDTRAVIRALKTGHLGYLGIDVYEQEENLFFQDLSETIIKDDVIARLMTFPNVLVTAHQAFFTDEALSEIARVTLANIAAFDRGEALVNAVK